MINLIAAVCAFIVSITYGVLGYEYETVGYGLNPLIALPVTGVFYVLGMWQLYKVIQTLRMRYQIYCVDRILDSLK